MPPDLRDWCAAALGGPITVEADLRQTHGESLVWRIRTPAGEAAYLKSHRQPGKWAGEVHAYERWVRPAFGDAAPRLISCSPDAPRAALISDLPGSCMARLDLTPNQKRAGWEAAGRALARLHGLATNDWIGGVNRDGSPNGETHSDAPAYYVARIDTWVERGNRIGCLLPGEAEFACAAIRDWSGALAGERAVPVHRDYTPRNWIASPESGRWVGVIDFEHARWDLRVMDICRPWTREFLEDPACADAFFAGYRGGPPDAQLLAQILAVRLNHCFTSLIWAAEKDDLAFVAESRAGLAALREMHNKGTKL